MPPLKPSTWNALPPPRRGVRRPTAAQSHWCPSCAELLDAGRCDACGYGHPSDIEHDDFTGRPFGTEDD